MDQRGHWDRLIEYAGAISTEAIELAALSEPELPGLLRYLGEKPVLPFRYVSVHAPSKDRAMPEADLVDLLATLNGLVDAVVVHPDTLVDLDSWRALAGLLVVENMDSRKRTGRTSDELEPFFAALPDARLCLDIAHAWVIDPSMAETGRMLDRFGDRLRQVHVSSLDAGQHHVPLTEEHEALFGPFLDRCRDVPWILEAPPRAVGTTPRVRSIG